LLAEHRILIEEQAQDILELVAENERLTTKVGSLSTIEGR
jgi:hypothetical protein